MAIATVEKKQGFFANDQEVMALDGSTDEELADKIRGALREMNTLLGEAGNRGLEVDAHAITQVSGTVNFSVNISKIL